MSRPCVWATCAGYVRITAGSGSGIIRYGMPRGVGMVPWIRRTNAGRVMTRPDIPDHHDPMHMIRHHHEFPDVHMRHMFRYRIPTPLHEGTQRRWMHHPARDPSEQVHPCVGVRRHEKCTRLGIIIPAQPDGTTMETIGHERKIPFPPRAIRTSAISFPGLGKLPAAAPRTIGALRVL